MGDPLVVSGDRELLAIERLQQRGKECAQCSLLLLPGRLAGNAARLAQHVTRYWGPTRGLGADAGRRTGSGWTGYAVCAYAA